MRCLRLAFPLVLSIAVLSRPALSQDTSATHREAVKQLMTVTHLREVTEQSMDAVLKSQMEQMPQLKPYESVMKSFLKEQMDWNTLEPEYMRLYMDVFTEKETRDITAFYQTPLGKMMLTKMPVLMAKSNELAQRRLQAGLPVLMQRLQAAMQANPPATAPSDH